MLTSKTVDVASTIGDVIRFNCGLTGFNGFSRIDVNQQKLGFQPNKQTGRFNILVYAPNMPKKRARFKCVFFSGTFTKLQFCFDAHNLRQFEYMFMTVHVFSVKNWPF